MYTGTYVCINVHVHTYVYMYIRTCIYAQIHMYVKTHKTHWLSGRTYLPVQDWCCKRVFSFREVWGKVAWGQNRGSAYLYTTIGDWHCFSWRSQIWMTPPLISNTGLSELAHSAFSTAGWSLFHFIWAVMLSYSTYTDTTWISTKTIHVHM